MRAAIDEHWIDNPKYQTLPELMLRYRAATLLIRTHAPEVLNGMHMVEEIEDVSIARDVTPTAQQKEEIKENAANAKSLAENLIGMCKNAGLNAKEFAEFAGVSRNDPNTIENAIENFKFLKETFMEVQSAAA